MLEWAYRISDVQMGPISTKENDGLPCRRSFNGEMAMRGKFMTGESFDIPRFLFGTISGIIIECSRGSSAIKSYGFAVPYKIKQQTSVRISEESRLPSQCQPLKFTGVTNVEDRPSQSIMIWARAGDAS